MLCAVVLPRGTLFRCFFFFFCGEEMGLGRMVLVCDFAGAMIRLPNPNTHLAPKDVLVCISISGSGRCSLRCMGLLGHSYKWLGDRLGHLPLKGLGTVESQALI